MKTFFIKAESKADVFAVAKKFSFTGRIGLLTTAQHEHQLKEVSRFLKKSIIGGTVLGCNVSAAEKIKSKVDAFLFIGSGEFHPLQIALATGKEVFTANPLTNQIGKVSEEEILQRKKRIRGAYLKFLSAKKIGILVSTKPGQNNLPKAEEFKKSLKGKQSFIFLFNTLQFSELENFPGIECWVNTACLRIAYEDFKQIKKPIINLSDIESFKRNES